MIKIGTHSKVVVMRQRLVAKCGAPQRSQGFSLAKIGHFDTGFEEGTGRSALSVGQ